LGTQTQGFIRLLRTAKKKTTLVFSSWELHQVVDQRQGRCRLRAGR
jgi:hypothetical protein